MNEKRLTIEEQAFAEQNHRLVYRFLAAKNLPCDGYYDIVIFGYLDAVKVYFASGYLKRFAFATIAWRHMEQALGNHHRYRVRKKRCHPVEECTDKIEAAVSSQPMSVDMLHEIELSLLMDALNAEATDVQMKLFRLRAAGYSFSEIARITQTSVRQVKNSLRQVKSILRRLNAQ